MTARRCRVEVFPQSVEARADSAGLSPLEQMAGIVTVRVDTIGPEQMSSDSLKEFRVNTFLSRLVESGTTAKQWIASSTSFRKVVRLTDQLTLNKITAAWRLWRTFSFGSVHDQKHRYSKVPHIGEACHLCDEYQSLVTSNTRTNCYPVMYEAMNTNTPAILRPAMCLLSHA